MDLYLLRQATDGYATTFGELAMESGPRICFTLEDAVREIPGVPVEVWKVPNQTAIPAGRYKLTLENSPRFGPRTLTINDVPGFSGVRMHSGDNKDDTEGCIILGDVIGNERIHGGKLHAIVDKVKAIVENGLTQGDVWLTIINPGDH